NSNAISTTIIGPPINSAAANCHPISTMMIMVSSATKFVDASWKAIAAVKLAPLRKIERASATAAYEQEDDAAPRPHAMASDFGESFGNSRVISLLETTACTTADKPKPRMSGHKISQNMANAIQRAWPRAVTISITATQRRGYERCTFMRRLAASCRLRGFHVFGVFAEPGLAVAQSAVMECPLRVGDIRRLAFPCFEYGSL